MDGYQNSTGFSITAAQQLAYNQWIAQEAHALGMAVFQKNDPDQAGELQPSFDGVIDEQCNEYSECSAFQPYVAAGKPVLDAEYQASSYPGFCSADQSAGIMGALYALALDGSVYRPCFAPVTTTPLPAAPAPAPAPGATPKAAGPQKAVRALEIRSGRLVLRRGAVSIRLACPRGRGACAGTVQLFTAARAVRLGRAHFRLAGATSRAVRMKLSKQRLHRLHRRSVRVVVRVADRNVRARPSRMSRTAILALHPRHRRHHR
jgi:Glycoside-hydrolase family GH114